jgi:hypothetical protein
MEVDPARGGAAAAAERRLGAGHCAGGRESRAEHVPEEEERGGVREDLFGNSKNFRDLTVKKDFPLI